MTSTNPLAVVCFSGGLDSAVLAYQLVREEGFGVYLLLVDYGQRNRRELAAADTLAASLDVPLHRLYVPALGSLLGGSALTDPTIPLPDAGFTDPAQRATIVPNRNAILLSFAYGVAVRLGASRVACGIHVGPDGETLYPDCRPAFLAAFANMQLFATDGLARPQPDLYAPFQFQAKAEIVRAGAALGVPFAQTWSCYADGAVHCGRCGACRQRQDAFVHAGLPDPTAYGSIV